MLSLKMLHHKLKVNMSDFDKQANDYMIHNYGVICPPSEDKNGEKEKPICTSNEFKAVCKELGIEYPFFKLGDAYINVYNCNNTNIQIDGLQFKLDYNKMTVKVENEDLVDIYSIDELKHKVNEYRRVYKLMNETMNKLQIEKDFHE